MLLYELGICWILRRPAQQKGSSAMTRTRLIVAAIAVVAMVCSMIPASGSEFRQFDAKAIAMGGAGVARPSPAYAVYYNPAAMATHAMRDKALGVSFGVIARDTGIGEHLNSLMERNWDAATSGPLGAEAGAIIDIITEIGTDDGLLILGNFAAGYRHGKLGLGVYGSMQVGAYADIDTVHVAQSLPLADANSFAFNQSELWAQGLMLVEVPVGYAREFALEKGKVNLGAAVKLIYGATYDISQQVTAGMDTIQDELRDAIETDIGFGIDLGAQYHSEDGKLSVGLLLRNINSPKFHTAADRSLAEDMQVRAGVAYTINGRWSTAVDIDLIENETLIEGYKSQTLGAGVSFAALPTVVLRGGLMTNLAASNSSLILSAGITIGGDVFYLDIAGTIPSDWQTIDTVDIPAQGSLSIALGGAW